jgi:hypothetical protein
MMAELNIPKWAKKKSLSEKQYHAFSNLSKTRWKPVKQICYRTSVITLDILVNKGLAIAHSKNGLPYKNWPMRLINKYKRAEFSK